MNTIYALAALVLAVLALLAAIAWFTETPAERARRRHASGWSQRRIAAAAGVSRHRVKAWVTA